MLLGEQRWSGPAPRPACRRLRRRMPRAPRPRSCRSRRRRRPRGPSAATLARSRQHRFDRGVLVGVSLEREGRGERLVHAAVDIDHANTARARVALGLDFQAVPRRRRGLSRRRLLLRLRPRSPPRLCSGAVSRIGAGIRLMRSNCVTGTYRRSPLAYSMSGFAGHAAGFPSVDQPAIATDAVVLRGRWARQRARRGRG